VRVRGPRTALVVEIEPDGSLPRGTAAVGVNLPGGAGGGAGHLVDVSLPVVDVRVETT
jgi:hypothetical protein